MKQYTESQYDDDLTVGTDDYDDSYYTGSVDLFEFASDEESPISRLKSLILSIDWEITDEVLMQFNEELVDLRDIWAGEKIHLIYIQALEKISKYIYQKKADSHPSAIKLLLTLYHNLEKIVSSEELSEAEKKEILLEDVKRFESLKRHISKPAPIIEDVAPIEPPKTQKKAERFVGSETDLLNLKAIVLGIDWEITDQDLNELRQEVVRLEEKFADSKPKLILLQGIGTLGAYIKLKKSDSHADAFKILHLFYDSLEKIALNSLTLEEQKGILYPAVEKFNSFKALLGPSISPNSDGHDTTENVADVPMDTSTIMPAFADYSEGEVRGFQAEEEAVALGNDRSGNIDSHVESFFTGISLFEEETPSTPDDFSSEAIQKKALDGVNVEIDDEENGEGQILGNNGISTALEGVISEEEEIEAPSDPDELDLSDDLGSIADESPAVLSTEGPESLVEPSLSAEEHGGTGIDFATLDKDTVLQGVDVETEADDDSDEDALPMMGDEPAPALAENDEVSIFSAESVEDPTALEDVGADIVDSLGGFFDEEINSHSLMSKKTDDDELEDDPVASLIEAEVLDTASPVESPVETLEEEIVENDQKLQLDIEGDELQASGQDELIFDEEFADTEPALSAEAEISAEEGNEDSIAFMSDLDQKDSLESLFQEGEFEQEIDDAVNETEVVEDSPLATSSDDETTADPLTIDDQLDSFFDMGEDEEAVNQYDAPLQDAEDDTDLQADSLFITPPEELPDEKGNEQAELEEEVVFELVEEEDDPTISDAQFASQMSLAEVDEEDGESIVEGFAADFAPILEDEKFEDAYGALQTCVDSLGLELDDKVILGLWGEIDHLAGLLSDKPMEKTFLQLLSTVTKHIDQNRYDADSEAFNLLKSVSSGLTDIQEDDHYRNQEVLFAETKKVLTWQEDILAQLTARREAELTISDSHLSEADANLDKVEADHGQDGDVVFALPEIVKDDFKDDISSLRRTLQDEIEELRKELKGSTK